MGKFGQPEDGRRSFGILNVEIRKRFWIREPTRNNPEVSATSATWLPIIWNILDFVIEPSIRHEVDTRVIMGLKKDEVRAVMGMVDEMSK